MNLRFRLLPDVTMDLPTFLLSNSTAGAAFSTTTATDFSLVNDNNTVGRGSLSSSVPTHPNSTGALFECAAGAQCTAKAPYNVFGSHTSWCCSKPIHSHVTCGMTEYISKNPRHVGYTFTSGQVIVANKENEKRTICYSCITCLASAKSPTPFDSSSTTPTEVTARILPSPASLSLPLSLSYLTSSSPLSSTTQSPSTAVGEYVMPDGMIGNSA